MKPRERLFVCLGLLAGALAPVAAQGDATTWYVNSGSGSDSNNGLSAATPFKTIAMALSMLTESASPTVDGDTILLADGTYYITSPITSNYSFRLASQSGDREKCIVDAQGACICVRLPTTWNNGGLACTWKISGITFRNGFSDLYDTWDSGGHSYSAAGLALGANAMVENCVVRDCRRVVSATDTSTGYLDICGGGVSLRGYYNVGGTDTDVARSYVPRTCPAPWDDVTPGLYNCVISDCTLDARMTRDKGNTAVLGGGLFCCYSIVSNVTVTGCTAKNACTCVESAQFGGGGIFADRGSRLVDCVVRDCRLEKVSGSSGWTKDGQYASGGGVYIQGAQTAAAITNDTDSIHDCLIEGNTVVGNAGGGLCADSVRVADCTIRTNTLILTTYSYYLDAQKKAVWYTNPTAYMGGTGVKLHGTDVSLTRSLIEGNRTEDRYGYVTGGPLELMTTTRARVTDTVVRDNTSGQRAALSLVYNTKDAFVSNLVAVGNVVTGKWCCISSGSSLYSLALTDSLFVSNRSHTALTSDPGGLESYAGLVTFSNPDDCTSNICIRNTLFLHNQTSASYGFLFGSGFWKDASKRISGYQPILLQNCTFAGNLDRFGKNYYELINMGTTGDDMIRIKGCVFADNYLGDTGRRGCFPKTSANWDITYSYCDGEELTGYTIEIPVTAANHNLNGSRMSASAVDPKFEDAGGGDYRIQKRSPLVDAGGPFETWMGTGRRSSAQDAGDAGYRTLPSGKYGVTVSLTETKPRRSGSAVDMGCFEYKPSSGFGVIVE